MSEERLGEEETERERRPNTTDVRLWTFGFQLQWGVKHRSLGDLRPTLLFILHISCPFFLFSLFLLLCLPSPLPPPLSFVILSSPMMREEDSSPLIFFSLSPFSPLLTSPSFHLPLPLPHFSSFIFLCCLLRQHLSSLFLYSSSSPSLVFVSSSSTFRFPSSVSSSCLFFLPLFSPLLLSSSSSPSHVFPFFLCFPFFSSSSCYFL